MCQFSIEECPCGGDVLPLLAHCVYAPDPAKLAAIAERYRSNGNLRLLGCRVDGRLAGVAGVDLADPDAAILLHLAVDPAVQGQGIGRTLIEALMERYSLNSLTTETDGDAVGFYENCRFVVTSLGEKYPGTIRYRCVRHR